MNIWQFDINANSRLAPLVRLKRIEWSLINCIYVIDFSDCGDIKEFPKEEEAFPREEESTDF